MSSCDLTALKQRTFSDLDNQTINAIRSVTLNMNTFPVGTFKYKLFSYPGDIDIFETIEECCSYGGSKLKVAAKLQKLICKTLQNPDILFVEFKAGYDNRFKIYTGTINDDRDYEDFYPVIVRRDLTNLYEMNLLTHEEYEEFIYLSRDDTYFEDILLLNEKLRSLWTVRWSYNEILQGYKILRGNYKLYFDIAITQGSIIKLDTIYKAPDRYIELTNFFLVRSRDREGKISIFSEEMKDYGESLLSDVHKYYSTNTLKAIKRYWMYLSFKGQKCDLSIYKSLFSGHIAEVSQILADVETAIFLQTSSLNYDEEFLSRSLTSRLNKLNGLCRNTRNLEEIKDCLINWINVETQKWLVQSNISILGEN